MDSFVFSGPRMDIHERTRMPHSRAESQKLYDKNQNAVNVQKTQITEEIALQRTIINNF